MVNVEKKPTPKLQCDGDYLCTPPKECCTLGCCYLFAPPSPNIFNIIFWNHWYLWCVLLFCLVLCCTCVCGFWKKREERLSNDEVRSELSGGSYYQPPHYSRCTSLHQPPPYAEVTSKPDLYPLVISYSENRKSSGRGSYLMVQYFRDYIMRPVGSLSGTSTADSLNSSLICNVNNEAHILVPPPYSSAPGSVDQFQVSIPSLNQLQPQSNSHLENTTPSIQVNSVSELNSIQKRYSLSLQINKSKYWFSRSAPSTPASRLMPSTLPSGESSPLLTQDLPPDSQF